MLREFKNKDCHYFQDDQNRIQGECKTWHNNGTKWVQCVYRDNKLHGEFKSWWENGQIKTHCFYVNGKKHGEYKYWEISGYLYVHCFYVNGEYFSFDEIMYPGTDEDRMYFKLKHDLQLLPMETIC